MPRLLVEGERAACRTFTLFGHPGQVTQDPVDRDAVHSKPGTAVDPRPPTARRGHGHLGALPASSQLPERGQVEFAVVVHAEIDIGIRPMRAPCATTAQGNGANTGDAREVSGHVRQARVADHHRSLRTTRCPRARDRVPPEGGVDPAVRLVDARL